MKLVLAKLWRKLHLPASIQLRIMRLFQDQFLVGVTGIILNKQNEVLLFRHTYRQKEWSLPGGYMKASEHPKEGLEREILEESGLVVSADERCKIRTDRDDARLDIVYTGVYIDGEFRPSYEVTEGRFFSFDTLPDIRKSDLLLISSALDPGQKINQKI